MAREKCDFEIKLLADAPHLLPVIVKAHVDKWANADNGMTYEAKLIEFQQAYMRKSGIPVCFVVILNNEYVGMVRLKEPAHSGLADFNTENPWVGSFQVSEHHRGRGIGTALLRQALLHARDNGFDTLNIWTDATNFYDNRAGFTYKGLVDKKEGGLGRLFEIDINEALSKPLRAQTLSACSNQRQARYH